MQETIILRSFTSRISTASSRREKERRTVRQMYIKCGQNRNNRVCGFFALVLHYGTNFEGVKLKYYILMGEASSFS